MGLKDEDDMRKTYLYKLSKAQGMNWFKEIVLVSSPQDTYSPFDSSRIQVGLKNSSNMKTSPIYEEMVDNITNQLTCSVLRRVDVCFSFPQSTLDTWIGRAAHIALINDSLTVEAFAYRYSDKL